MTRSTTAADPVERVISLLWLLLHEPRGYARDQIRRLVVGYEDLGEAAFEKTFQRDRRVLRQVGVPLEVVTPDPGDPDAETIHRVDRGALLLPELDLSVDERRALVRARRLWADSPLRSEVVRAVGVLFHPDDAAAPDVLDGYHALAPRADPRLETAARAAAAQSGLAFDYRDAGGTLRRRTVRAWFLTQVRGRWYLTGWDVDRRAERSFRLSRMESDPVTVDTAGLDAPSAPEDHDQAGLRARLAGRADAERVRVWLAPGRGQGLRVAGRPVAPGEGDQPAPGPDWELWSVPAGSQEDGVLPEVAALAGAALFSPAEPHLAERLAHGLTAAAAAHAGEPDAGLVDVSLSRPVRRRARDSSEDVVGRLLDIVGLANRSGGIDRAELQARLGVDAGRLARDLETLRYCGMPEREFPGFQFDVEEADGRVVVHRAEELEAPVRLTLPEAHTLVGTLQTVAEMSVLTAADRAAATSAQRRIRAALVDVGRDPEPAAALESDDAASADGPRPLPVSAHWDVVVDSGTVRTLLEAVAEHRVLRLRYHGVRSDEVTERDVEPLGVAQDHTRLYLHAWCRRADGLRVFRVDRISAADPTGETFRPRARPSGWRPEAAAADEGIDALVRWSHPVRDAADAYRPSAETVLADGTRLTRVVLRDAEAGVQLAARHGGQVEVLAPPALRAEVARRLGSAAALARGR